MQKPLKFTIIACLFSLLVAPICSAQVVMRLNKGDQEGGAPPAVQQRALVVEASDDGNGNLQFHSFSSDGGDFFMASPMSWGGLPADPSQLIMNPQVRKDLELDDDQMKQIRDLQKDFTKRMQDRLNFKNGDPNQYKELGKIIQQINKEREEAMGAILLPHQSKRLKQIAAQMDMKNRGDANALIGKNMAEELGINDEQKKRIQDKAAEIKKEMEEEIAKIKEKGRKKLLRELSSDQRSKLEEMLGDKFEYKKVDWRDRIKKARERRDSEDDR